MLLSSSFPDERYDSFDAWVAAMSFDDTCEATSELWKSTSSGQWLLYGLGLQHGLRILEIGRAHV